MLNGVWNELKDTESLFPPFGGRELEPAPYLIRGEGEKRDTRYDILTIIH